jgi:hypothetical protein
MMDRELLRRVAGMDAEQRVQLVKDLRELVHFIEQLNALDAWVWLDNRPPPPGSPERN